MKLHVLLPHPHPKPHPHLYLLPHSLLCHLIRLYMYLQRRKGSVRSRKTSPPKRVVYMYMYIHVHVVTRIICPCIYVACTCTVYMYLLVYLLLLCALKTTYMYMCTILHVLGYSRLLKSQHEESSTSYKLHIHEKSGGPEQKGIMYTCDHISLVGHLLTDMFSVVLPKCILFCSQPQI